MDARSEFDPSLLRTRVRGIASHAKRLVVTIQACQSLVVILGLSLLVASMDFVLRSEEIGTKFLFSGFLGIIALFALARVLRAFFSQPDLVSIAKRIEVAMGIRQGWLSSIIGIEMPIAIGTWDPSHSLRQRAIHDAESYFRSIPLETAISSSLARRWLILASIVACSTLVLCAITPQNTFIAVMRLIAPWRDMPWPRKHCLEFVDLPQVVPFDQKIVLKVRDRNGRLPDQVQIFVRGEGLTEQYAVATESHASVATFPLGQLRSTIAVRAEGGDDHTMEWQEVQLAQRSSLVEHEWTIQPPSYSREPMRRFSSHSFEVLAGTRVQLQGSLSENVESLELVADHPELPQWRAILSPDRRHFVVDGLSDPGIVIDSTLRMELRWRSKNLDEPSRAEWTIQARKDESPRVSIIRPETNLHTTQLGSIPIAGFAEDDVGLLGITLHWHVLDDQRELLLERKKELTPGDWQPNSRSWQGEYSFVPSKESNLLSSQSILFWLVARDSLGQIGESEKMELLIQEDQEILSEIEEERTAVEQLLARSIQEQRLASQATEWARTVSQSTAEQGDSIAHIAMAVSRQKNVRDLLNGDEESILAILDALRERLNQNELKESPIAQELDTMRAQVQALGDVEVSKAMSELLAIQSQPRTLSSLVGSLRDSQVAIEKQLEQWHRALSNKMKLRDHERQMERIAEEQMRLAEDTASLGALLADDPSSALADEKRLQIQTSQLELALRLDQWTSDLRQQQDDSGGAPNLPRNPLQQRIAEKELSSKMRQAANLVQQNALDRAEQLQLFLSQELSDTLHPRNDSQTIEPPTGVDRSQEKQISNLDRLIQQQQGIVDDIQKLAATPNLENPSELDRIKILGIADAQDHTRKSLEDWFSKERPNATLRFAMELVQESMRRTHIALIRNLSGPIAGKHAQRALDRLISIRNASAPQADPSNGENPNSKTEKGAQEENQSRVDRAQIILLRDLQSSIRDRLHQVHQNAPEGKLTPEDWLELNDLAHLQDRLAGELQKLIEVPSAP